MLFRGRPNTHTLSRYALSYLSQSGSAAQRRELDVGLVFYLKQYDPFWKANRSIKLQLLGLLKPQRELDVWVCIPSPHSCGA